MQLNVLHSELPRRTCTYKRGRRSAFSKIYLDHDRITDDSGKLLKTLCIARTENFVHNFFLS